MSEPFVAEIRIVGFNFPPKGWAFCNGQIMAISQNTALFSLLGTTFGGDGKSNFALPDLQGRAPMHYDQGPGLSFHGIGESGGQSTHTLTISELPAHSHALNATSTVGSQTTIANGFPAQPNANARFTNLYSGLGSATLDSRSVTMTGSGLAHNNMQPYLGLNFVIALQGVFPARA